MLTTIFWRYPGYIHLNPIRVRAFRKKGAEEKWNALLGIKWSSLPGYLALRKRENFIKYDTVLGHMGADGRKGRLAYRKFIKWGIDKDVVNPLDLGKGLGIAGEEGFFKWVKQEFLLSYVSALKLAAAASGTCTGRFGRASAATGRITGSRETWA